MSKVSSGTDNAAQASQKSLDSNNRNSDQQIKSHDSNTRNADPQTGTTDGSSRRLSCQKEKETFSTKNFQHVEKEPNSRISQPISQKEKEPSVRRHSQLGQEEKTIVKGKKNSIAGIRQHTRKALDIDSILTEITTVKDDHK